MNRGILIAIFVILVGVPLAGLYLINQGLYPAAIANGTVITGRSFEREVGTASRSLGTATVSALALRRAVLDHLIGIAVSDRRSAHVVVLVPDLTWDGKQVVARK